MPTVITSWQFLIVDRDGRCCWRSWRALAFIHFTLFYSSPCEVHFRWNGQGRVPQAVGENQQRSCLSPLENLACSTLAAGTCLREWARMISFRIAWLTWTTRAGFTTHKTPMAHGRLQMIPTSTRPALKWLTLVSSSNRCQQYLHQDVSFVINFGPKVLLTILVDWTNILQLPKSHPQSITFLEYVFGFLNYTPGHSHTSRRRIFGNTARRRESRCRHTPGNQWM